jgi:NADPH2:quinone reductase
MRAWQVERTGEPREVLRLVDIEPPQPGPGLLRVRVRAAALGLPDVLLCRGSYALTPPHPFIAGQELVGEVTAVGAGARRRVGERVMAVSGFHLGSGSLAAECLALDDFALAVPEEMPDEEAAGFPIAFHTAHAGLVRRGKLRAGETLLVLGAAGGTGSAAVQLGAALGARVIATAGGEQKAEYCKRLGADLCVDYRSEDIAAAVRDSTGGRGVDVVFDTVGGDAFKSATRCLATEARVLLIGFASGGWAEPSVPHMVVGNYSLLGVLPNGFAPEYRTQAHVELLAHWRAGRLRASVHRIFPFTEVPDAIAEVASGSAMGKVIVSMSELNP